jgi:hypothetical protein
METIKMGWVRASLLCELKGYTKDSLKKDKANGLYIEDLHWIKDLKGRIWWNYEEVDKYIGKGFVLNV